MNMPLTFLLVALVIVLLPFWWWGLNYAALYVLGKLSDIIKW